MVWNEENDYLEFKLVYKNICNLLGISCINYWSCTHLAPYITRIMQYLNKRLMILDSDNLLDKIEETFSVFNYGADLIVHEKTLDLAKEVNVLDVDETDEVKYNQDRFVFCWSNIMSSLIERLKLQYYDLLHPQTSNDCPCSCSHGETQKDWDSYTSGVWPEDEETGGINFSSTVSWRATSGTSECLCSGRDKADNESSY